MKNGRHYSYWSPNCFLVIVLGMSGHLCLLFGCYRRILPIKSLVIALSSEREKNYLLPTPGWKLLMDENCSSLDHRSILDQSLSKENKVQLWSCVNSCIQRNNVDYTKKLGVLNLTRNIKEFQCSNSFIYIILTPMPTPSINHIKSWNSYWCYSEKIF